MYFSFTETVVCDARGGQVDYSSPDASLCRWGNHSPYLAMPGTSSSECTFDNLVYATECLPGVYYWQDYDLIGENWEQLTDKWETLA